LLFGHGRRIFVVITPQGQKLQVFRRFPTPIYDINCMAVVGNKLRVFATPDPLHSQFPWHPPGHGRAIIFDMKGV
jgi:hypothetical protein